MTPCQTLLLPTVRVLGREREGGREGSRKEGRKEEKGEGLVTSLKYDLVYRSAADGCWSKPVY